MSVLSTTNPITGMRYGTQDHCVKRAFQIPVNPDVIHLSNPNILVEVLVDSNV